MSIASDLAAVFEDVASTCPVQYAGQVEVRGFLDRSQQVATKADIGFTATATALRVLTGALVDIVAHSSLLIGALGAADADDGEDFTIIETLLEDDGLVSVLVLVEGAP